MRPRFAFSLISLVLAACAAEKPGMPAGPMTTGKPSVASESAGSGVTVPGSTLSSMPATGTGGPMQGSAGMNVAAPQQPAMTQTGSQLIGKGPAQYRLGSPANVQ
ncbi:MAG: hypothetical protein JO110_16965 [Acetobacteraceae bacterium]|nr:hypothetical protein [Acetobacteraceae bacterium]